MKRWPVTGLYAITPDTSDTNALLARVRCALAGGARLVQYRSKSADSALRHRQARELLDVCRRAGRPFVINDDLDLTLAVDADGLHLGRDDCEISVARERLGTHKLLGASCYDRLELAAAALRDGVDYVAFGSAYPSATKPGAIRAPLQLYREARRRFSIPIVAIGGITLDNAPPLLDAGVDALAVISALFDAPDVESAARKFSNLFRRDGS